MCSSQHCMACIPRQWLAHAEYFVFLEDLVRNKLPAELFVATLPYAQRLADEVDRMQVHPSSISYHACLLVVEGDPICMRVLKHTCTAVCKDMHCPGSYV